MEGIRKEQTEYDPVEGEKLASWCFSLLEHASEQRAKKANPDNWEKVWAFIRGKQWEGDFPTYRRPIVHNVWKRVLHIMLAVLIGERPIVKIVPQGQVSQKDIDILQHAFWAVWEKEHIGEVKYPLAWLWALTCNGGWMKLGYGRKNPFAPDDPDVIVKTVHPAKVYPDPECTDVTLSDCSYIIYREVVDLSDIYKRYPQQAKYVEPEEDVSWVDNLAGNSKASPTSSFTIVPAGGWMQSQGGQYRRARANVIEVWIDDPSLELTYVERYTGVDANTGQPIITKVPVWTPKYPYGRLITCTKNVVLRDIPNPYGEFWGWDNRWPFVYLPGSLDVDPVWSPGILSTVEEEQRAINRTMQLLLENAIKFSAGYIIADDMALDDEDWDLLALIPGVKIRKKPQSEFKIEWPAPMPEHMLRMPDYFATKIEQEVGLHDPPLMPGQAVAAKTVEFLQRKGNYLLGLLAKNGDAFLERLAARILGLILGFYEYGRRIPYFDKETHQVVVDEFPDTIPRSLRFRVESTSAWLEIMAAVQRQMQTELAQQRARSRRT